jgi:hypothetical protein
MIHTIDTQYSLYCLEIYNPFVLFTLNDIGVKKGEDKKLIAFFWNE